MCRLEGLLQLARDLCDEEGELTRDLSVSAADICQRDLHLIQCVERLQGHQFLRHDLMQPGVVRVRVHHSSVEPVRRGYQVGDPWQEVEQGNRNQSGNQEKARDPGCARGPRRFRSLDVIRALVDLHPDADPGIVLPAILLHDTGWSQVDPADVLKAIEPGAGRHDLVITHEKEGARLATEILTDLGFDQSHIDEIVTIIDGHDTRLTALSLNDALVKDADKLWRLTPHGVDTVMDWFGLDREQAHRLIGHRVHAHLFTEAARTMARALAAVASIDCSPELLALG